MAVYAIGDIQGCYDSLHRLLDRIRYEPDQDTLWFTGDLVNRGPKSLEVLRFVRSLRSAITVLGNHDLHLLAVAAGQAPHKKHDTFGALLEADDRTDLLDWLRQRPLIHHDESLGFTLVHAGLLPQWDLMTAQALAHEAEHYIAHSENNDLYRHMYGDTPDHWEDRLAGWARIRVIINAFTRLRYCTPDGRMDLRPKMRPGLQPQGLIPWFRIPGRRTHNNHVIFGHWSTLGLCLEENFYAIDSGCLWGQQLTAVRLDVVNDCVQVNCPQTLIPRDNVP